MGSLPLAPSERGNCLRIISHLSKLQRLREVSVIHGYPASEEEVKFGFFELPNLCFYSFFLLIFKHTKKKKSRVIHILDGKSNNGKINI